MTQLELIVGAYAIGAWAAAIWVCLNWLRNQPVTLNAYLTVTGWGGVLTLVAAITHATT